MEKGVREEKKGGEGEGSNEPRSPNPGSAAGLVYCIKTKN